MMITKNAKNILIILVMMLNTIALPIYSQSTNRLLTDKQIGAIFNLDNKYQKCNKERLSFQKELSITDSIANSWKKKYNYEHQININNKLQIALFDERLNNKEQQNKNNISLWRVKRNSAYLKGGVLGVILTLLGITLIH